MRPPEYTALPLRFWAKIANVPDENGCWIWLGAKSMGYGRIILKRKVVQAHHLTAREMHGPIPNGLFALHKCDVRACVNPHHIYYGTPKRNSTDMVQRGRSSKGERNGMCKLTEHDVRVIRDTYARGGTTQASLAEQYSLTNGAVSMIISRTRWKHVI